MNKKDKKNRLKLNLNEFKNFILKAISKNLRIPKFTRWNLILKTNAINSYNSKSFLLNFCIITKNKKFFNKNFRFSRFAFLRMVRFGFIAGIKKACW